MLAPFAVSALGAFSNALNNFSLIFTLLLVNKLSVYPISVAV
nr:MAG TPA: hypothetical protein [Caudoviricetes sp.]